MRRALFALLVATAALATAPPVLAQDDAGEENWTGRNVIEVTLGGSTTVTLTGSVGKVTLTDPKVAEVSATGRGLLIVGRQIGETNLIMFGGGGQSSSYLIKVTLPARAIQSELERLFPGQQISARAVGGSLVLTGTVSDTSMVQQAEDVAIGYLRSPSFAALGVQPHVINLLHVRSRDQVMLEVKFAEVKRTSLREMGVHTAGHYAGSDLGVGVAAGSTAVNAAGSGIIGRPLPTFGADEGAAGALFISKPDGKFPFAATLSILAQRALARTLAEPTLIAMSGQKANFLAGGEVPFTVTSLDGPNVQFKPFGVELEFTPDVQADDTVQLRMRTSVSALDRTISSGGTFGFKTRSSETTIRLRDGQSFAIAGLLNDEINNTVDKVPGLGDLPVLGLLFSSKSFQREETELLVIVTARLVQPIDGDNLPPLPGQNQTSDPTDLELFLGNIHEPTKRSAPKRPAGGDDLSGLLPDRRPAGKVGFWR